MRKIREILRLLWHLGLGARGTARACSISHSTVLEYQHRAEQAELSWELVDEMDSGILEEKLFAPPLAAGAARAVPDWSETYKELKRPGVTLQLLWEEYKEGNCLAGKAATQRISQRPASSGGSRSLVLRSCGGAGVLGAHWRTIHQGVTQG